MSKVGQDDRGGQPPDGSGRSTVVGGNGVYGWNGTQQEMDDVMRLSEGPHRRGRQDSLDWEDVDHVRAKRGSDPTTYEQLRMLHPEKGNQSDSPIDQREGLLKSMTADLNTLLHKIMRAAKQKVKTTREHSIAAGPFFMKMLDKLPFIATVRTYKKEYFSPDFSAGLAEGIIDIPMGMSYALLANLPPVYGLYTVLIPPAMYCLFGTCSQLVLGVTAIESLLVAKGVSNTIGFIGDEVGNGTTQEDIDLKVKVTFAFTLCTAIWFFLMRVVGVGYLATLLSDPVLSGFACGSAFLIGTSQLKHLVGLDLADAHTPEIWVEALSNVRSFNWTALSMGLSGVALLFIMKKANDKYLPNLPIPIQMIVVILGTAVAHIWDLENTADLKVLGDIPSGLPLFRIPSFPEVEGVGGFSDYGPDIIYRSLIVAVMAYVITLSIGKTFARMNDHAYKIIPSQELVALFAASFVGCFFQSYTASASTSRTAVVQSVGAKTRMHTVPAVIVVMIVLVSLTHLLWALPKTILASVILFGLKSMIDFRDPKRLYHLSKFDFLMWNVSFWGTCLYGAVEAIAISVCLSVIFLLWQTWRPVNTILGRLPETREYRNLQRFPMAKEIPGIRIFRFDSSLHFANKDYFEHRLKTLEENPCGGVPIHTIVLDASSINQLDASAIDMLVVVANAYKARGISILCANWKGPQRDLLELSGVYEVIPPANIFLGLHDAVVEARKRSLTMKVAPVSAPEETGQLPQTQSSTKGTDTVVEVGPYGGTREWRVGAVGVNPSSGEVEREWGMGRV